MTLRELQIARGHLIDRALRHNGEDDWYDLEAIEHEIERRQEQRLADARLVDFHQMHYGAQPEDALLLGDFDDGLPPHHEDHT